MAFDFKKECRAPRLGKRGAALPKTPPSQINVACVSWAAGMKFARGTRAARFKTAFHKP